MVVRIKKVREALARIRYSFIKRFLARIRYAFRLKEIWSWRYEACNHCGSNYRLPHIIDNDTWIKVNGGEGGLLCFDCFLQLAQEKEVNFQLKHIDHLWVFHPDGESFDILDRLEEKGRK